MKISDILARQTHPVASIGHDQSFGAAIRVMQERRIGSVVVVHARSGIVTGLVSQPEILDALAELGTEFASHCVTGVMKRQPPVCQPSDSVGSVMRRMTNERSRHIIVTSEERLRGLVSIGDLVAAMLEESRLESAVLRDLAQSHLLAAPAH